MKGTFVAILVAGILALVIAERCSNVDSCKTTICPNNSTHLACDSGRCTCDAVLGCKDIIDCAGIGRCHDRNYHYHCVDFVCKCIPDNIGK
ncbi:serine protease inhibitor Cvsi-2-like [Crassostrea virginica]|uniref:Serine protease inhibitor Cvsi-1-like n=1 Tax=Crassostrea virginica TaxID=6565 RepID=A0A8B8CW35_CRAVI|nr:serine protease inhibitor Cvsi-1-like [Crassostrea virginica]